MATDGMLRPRDARKLNLLSRRWRMVATISRTSAVGMSARALNVSQVRCRPAHTPLRARAAFRLARSMGAVHDRGVTAAHSEPGRSARAGISTCLDCVGWGCGAALGSAPHHTAQRPSTWRIGAHIQARVHAQGFALAAVVQHGRRGLPLRDATRCDGAERVLRHGCARCTHAFRAHEHLRLAVRRCANHCAPASAAQGDRRIRASSAYHHSAMAAAASGLALPLRSAHSAARQHRGLHRRCVLRVARAHTAAARPIDGQPSTHEEVRWRLRAISMTGGVQGRRLQPAAGEGSADTELHLTVWPKFAHIAVDVTLRKPSAAQTSASEARGAGS
jgi:hypothetical protein